MTGDIAGEFWWCAYCLYVDPVPDDRADRAHTIINGQLVCEDHASYAGSPPNLAQARRASEGESAS